MSERGHGSLDLVPQVGVFQVQGEDLTEEEKTAGSSGEHGAPRGGLCTKPNEGAIVEGEAHNLGFLNFSCVGPGWLWAGHAFPDPAF